ncbi:MAG TPA: hypothetical protein VL461_06910 [Dictyobacter sp.]|jgi:hypothetical protein|nr:hypothetical protein [Dictyobacter sp.]
MYVYYILRATKSGEVIETEGDIDEETFPGVDLTEATDVITAAQEQLRANGDTTEWEECDLTTSYSDREDTYVYFQGRWIRRSEVAYKQLQKN